MSRTKVINYLTACAIVSIIMATLYVTVQQLYIGSRLIKVIEEQESNLSFTVFIAWIACLLTILLNAFIISIIERKNTEV